jgi:hypothetical protein
VSPPIWKDFVLLFLIALVIAATVYWWSRRRKDRRGFEVKRNTGETPVPLKERENDHG